jgi:isopenicillin N synthase-like dioxygenase
MSETLRIIDIAPLFGRDAAARGAVAKRIEAACRDSGFFYATGHGVSDAVLARLDAASRRFFALPRAAVHSFSGTYGDYLLSKVAKVFPQLKARVL